MKRVNQLVAMAIAVCVFAAVSCKDDKEDAPTLNLAPSGQTAVTFKADGTADGNATFTVATNQASWKAESNQAWVTVSKNGNSFTLNAAANTATTAPAPAKVTVSATGATSIVIDVTQAAKVTEGGAITEIKATVENGTNYNAKMNEVKALTEVYADGGYKFDVMASGSYAN
ncbi:MAG: hypothetical protein LBN37_03600, partial [Bacteroidales bacterium]|nr:hypothetical protein [Bacteroidales bacterium]